MPDILRDKSKWVAIREGEEYEPLRNLLFKSYDKFCRDKDIPVIKFSDEEEFFKTGSRKNFEELYFARRHQLSVYAILSAIYPENDEYFEKLQDIICEICNEYSWQVPAHRPVFNRNKRDGLALFSCETGLYLAEIKYMFADRLSLWVIGRITAELDKRILTSFENEVTWIESLKSNWASVCGASIGMTFMYESQERFAGIQPRIDKMMQNYLDGIGDDGSTSEGTDYWNYGFCFYVMYYDNLRRYTGGRGKNGLKSEKVKKLASFYTSTLLDDDVATSFSDSSKEAEYYIWLMHFLKKEYDIKMPPFKSGFIGTSKFSAAVRAFLYFDPEYATEKTEPDEKYYDILEWYIKRGENYGFAVKGGNNGEEHNHNDIGSFIIAKNGEQILCDLGSAEYTADNFGKDRYKILNNSSLGHSVPIIKGAEQGTGKEFYGKLQCEDEISVDMTKAYPVGMNGFIRSFKLEENAVFLTDRFDPGIEITERFVTEIKPEIYGGIINVSSAKISFSDGWIPKVSEQTTKAHGGRRDRIVYLIDFTPDNKTDKFELEIKL